MLDQVYAYIQENNLIENGDSVIVGLSGGADSVCLFLILYYLQCKIGFQIRCVHINHGIRGQEAKEDEEYVQELCKKYGVPCSVYHYDVEDYARKNKLSSEEAGRIIRYKSFEEERIKTNSNKIAVAHNANDQAETVLLNLFRGTGLTGLCGIKAKRDEIIRPILCLTRKEIEDYCISNEVLYKTDKTNLEDIYTRNKIRLNLLPYVEKEINGQVINRINHTSHLLSEEEEYLSFKAMEAFNIICKVSEDNISVIEDDFLAEKRAIQRRVIRLALGSLVGKLKDIDSNHIESILHLFDKQVGKEIILPYGMVASRTYNKIILKKNNSIIDMKAQMCYDVIPGNDIVIEEGLALISTDIIICEENVNIPKKTYTKWFDYDKIKDKLQFRTRKPGDFIRVKGINGKKKLSDFFIDNKIPREKRDNILLLVEGNEIVWIVGYRISEKYKVTNSTKRILAVTLNGRYTTDVQEEI